MRAGSSLLFFFSYLLHRIDGSNGSRGGMPPAHANHASMPGITQQHQPPKDIDYAEVIAQPLAPKKRVVDKQSFEYAWRSGVAGGLAGCAVCTYQPRLFVAR